MNVLSLFAGIGGMDLGLERAGMSVVGQVEIDPYCQRVLAKHWPEVPRHDDVRTCVDWWRSEPRPGVDLVCGGFPCQPVSVAGRQLVQADERWLWPAMAAVVRALRPRWVLVENVPGLLARGMGDVLGDLAAFGYDTEWDCIPASAVGAPHRRDRVWIVAADASGQRGRVQPVAESGSCGTSVAVDDGAKGSLADADSAERRPEAGDAIGGAGRGAVRVRPTESRRCRGDVADPDGERLEGRRLSAGPRHRAADAGGSCTLVDWRRPEASGQWATEPDVGRVADGIPARVDRLRGLGNAVVPQVVENVGRLIVDAERRCAA